MLCSSPKKITQNGEGYAVKCGKCMPCKITKRSEWTARILLEQMSHEKSLFLTLTYNDENLPQIHDFPNGNLIKKDLQNFFKRLRKSLPQTHKIRYFAVGEYGEKSKRAHYHAIIFNLSIDDEALVQSAWTFGFAYIGECTPQSASYVARYTTKKITGELAHDHYEGKQPEFMLSSRKPALGTESATLIAETMAQHPSRDFLYEGVIRIQGRKYKLDNFMLRHISHYYQKIAGKPMAKPKSPHLTEIEQIEERKKSDIRAKRYAKKGNNKEKI